MTFEFEISYDKEVSFSKLPFIEHYMDGFFLGWGKVRIRIEAYRLK